MMSIDSFSFMPPAPIRHVSLPEFYILPTPIPFPETLIQ